MESTSGLRAGDSVFDPSDPGQGEGLEGVRRQPLEEVTEFVEGLIDGGPGAVVDAIASVSKHGRRVLTFYVRQMAERAANRGGERRLLVDALVANVVAGLEINRRENIRLMALIDDAAGRLALDLPELFDEVAAIVGHPADDSLTHWQQRSPESRSLATMRYVAVEEADEVIYVSDLSMS
jgi:hypothetical protein